MKTYILKYITAILMLAASFISCTEDFEETYAAPQESKIRTRSVQDISGDTDFFYAYDGKKESFTVRRDRVIIKADSEAKVQELVGNPVFLSAYGMSYIWVIGTIDPSATDLEDLMQIPGVADATYGLEYTDGTMQFPKDIIYARLNGTTAAGAFDKIGRKDDIKSVELSNPERNGYRITLNAPLSEILKICRELYECGVLEIATPSFIRETKSHDEHHENKSHSQRAGQYEGAYSVDINLESAWTITKGSPDIKIAVIDTGVDLTHPDLRANLLPGYDVTIGSPGGINGGPYVDASPFFTSNAHGTACAGIIGANNVNGVVGVAPNCKIIPIRIGWCRIDGTWSTDDIRTAAAIHHAWYTYKADVLNNSWGKTLYGSKSPEIEEELNNALTMGRNGKGCVVVFSSGNDTDFGIGRGVIYPANINPEILTVGAISTDGRRYAGGGGNWGSNYGAELDIVAPGVNIYTTDIQGAAGYSTGDYYDSFSGTSAAAPYVSGIAALLLSVNPNLTRQQVADIIEWSAQKVGGYNYATMYGRNNGTWHEEMGYGLVDAGRALSFSKTINLTNRAFYFDTTYSGWEITTRDVTVKSGATLILKAPTVTINDCFEVEAGATFIMGE